MKHKILLQWRCCQDGLDYAEKFDTLREAWDNCERGDWLLWFAQNVGVGLRLFTLAKGLCANTVRHLMRDKRSIAAVDAAIAFGRGEIEIDELRTAMYNSADAAATKDGDAAPVCAALAADIVCYSACASYAADAAEYAAEIAGENSGIARRQNETETADICRDILTEAVFAKFTEMETQ